MYVDKRSANVWNTLNMAWRYVQYESTGCQTESKIHNLQFYSQYLKKKLIADYIK